MASSTAQASSADRVAPATGLAAALEAVNKYGPRAAGVGLPFLLVVYLGLKGGGYDSIVRGEVGIAIWWIVVLGAGIGLLPTTPPRRLGWIGLGLLASFGAWTGIGIIWSGSADASVTEFARVVTYLGVFVLFLSARRPEDTRRMVNGLACGMAVIGIVALLSRLHPSWFPEDETVQFLGSRNRLSYPLNYWNGLAALMAMAIPLLLVVAVRARTIVASTAAAAAVPAMALTAFFTLSRGGAIEVGVAVAVLILLAPRRFSLLPTLLAAAAGSATLIFAASRRNALTDGFDTPLAHDQGDKLLVIALVVCGVVAMIQIAIRLAARRGVGPRLVVPPRAARRAAAVALVLFAIIAVGAGGPKYLSDKWEEFKTPTPTSTGVARFESSTGSGRYQTWSAAVDANATDPLIGIGPGTYENWWAKERPLALFARDAHSLYLETLGELGIIGFLLITGFVITVLVEGARRSLKGDSERRWPYAAATSSAAAFAAAAGIDWAWELSVLPVAFMVLAGGLLASRRYRLPSPRRRLVMRSVLIASGVAAIVIIAIPLLGAESIRDSQAAVRSGDLESALNKANHAHNLQPYAATAELQQALVLELMGEYKTAVAAASEATHADSGNWRPWLVLSRLEAERGHTKASVAAYVKAKSLNPKSPLFAQG
jgi:hypothetical protein